MLGVRSNPMISLLAVQTVCPIRLDIFPMHHVQMLYHYHPNRSEFAAKFYKYVQLVRSPVLKTRQLSGAEKSEKRC